MSETQTSDFVTGAWDCHVHADPSLFERWGDAWALVDACQNAGMAGVVLKSHHGSSVEAASLVGAKTPSLTVVGGIVLNAFVGGVNALAAEASIALGGRIVWLPTIHAAAHEACFGTLGGFPFQQSRVAGRPPQGLRIIDPAGRLTSATQDLLDVMHGRDAVLGTGHVSAEEIYALVLAIRERRLDIRLFLTHVFFKIPGLSVDQLRALQSDQVWFEAAYFTISPKGNATARQVAASIRAIPSAQWVLSSDSGQPSNPPSPAALTLFARSLVEEGVDAGLVRRMLTVEPNRLLGR